MVKERVWENIQAFNTERLDPALFDIFYANSWEVPEEKLGLQYLKDGDVNGATWFEERNRHFYYTFISKENGVGENSEPMYIDLKKLRPISELRFYAMRHLGSNCPQTAPDNTPYIGPQYFSRFFANKLPSPFMVAGRIRIATIGMPCNGRSWLLSKMIRMLTTETAGPIMRQHVAVRPGNIVAPLCKNYRLSTRFIGPSPSISPNKGKGSAT
jgi:hypothetical protein